MSSIPMPSRSRAMDGTRSLRRDLSCRSDYLSLMVFAAAVAVLVPRLVQSRTGINLVDLWLLYSLAGVGFYWIFALSGRFAFCQTAMMTLGGYTAAFLALKGWPFLPALVAGAAAAGAAGLVVGLILWRVEELYFAIGTLAVGEVANVVFQQSNSFTGAEGNVTGVPYPRLFGHDVTTDRDFLWLFLAAVVLAMLLSLYIRRSPMARELTALRARPVVARTLGVPVRRLQLVLFVAGSAVGGISGALLTYWHGSISNSSFGLDLGIGLFLMAILGGVASPWGVLIGAAFYVWAPEALSGLQNYMPIVYGTALLVVILAAPEGLIGLVGRLVPRDLVTRRMSTPRGAVSSGGKRAHR